MAGSRFKRSGGFCCVPSSSLSSRTVGLATSSHPDALASMLDASFSLLLVSFTMRFLRRPLPLPPGAEIIDV